MNLVENIEKITDTFIQLIKILIEGVFIYCIAKRKGLIKIGIKHNTKEMFKFVFLFVLIIFSFYLYFSNNIILRPLSEIFLLFYLIYKAKSLKEWRFILTYSVFINCVLEFISMIASLFPAIVSSFLFQSLEIKYIISYAIGSMMLILTYLILIVIVYKLDLIKNKAIRFASKNNPVFICINVYMISILLVKYIIKNADKYYWATSINSLLTLVSPLFLYIVFLMNKSDEEKVLKGNLLEEVQVKKSSETMNTGIADFNAVYESEKEKYKKRLLVFGINPNVAGYLQLLLAIIIAKNFKGNKIRIGKDVYVVVARMLGNTNEKAVSVNISNAIKRGWKSADIDIIEGAYPSIVDPEKGAPTSKEFIMFMANDVYFDNDEIVGKKKGIVRVCIF